MRILIAGTVDVAEDKREKALIDAEPYIQAALAEPGCVAYSWAPDPFNPQRIHVFEEWTGEKELAYHLGAQPYKDMAGHLATVGILGAVTQKYRVDHYEPVYDPEGVPRADFFTAPEDN
ncbi:MAG: antibiotic biosynthesis monooxygenase [Pseudomonadota bacterium]